MTRPHRPRPAGLRPYVTLARWAPAQLRSADALRSVRGTSAVQWRCCFCLDMQDRSDQARLVALQDFSGALCSDDISVFSDDAAACDGHDRPARGLETLPG